MSIKYKLKQIRPNIFLLKFKNHYDMCMTFVRYQEFYESPSKQFRGKPFKLLDFMAWYSKKYGDGMFTYPQDWSGFNLSSPTIERVWKLGIPDYNDYDKVMADVYNKCYDKTERFYIIGAENGEKETLRHEIAHGMFYTNDSYKKEMISAVKSMDLQAKKTMHSILKGYGYSKHVYVDEIQAYMATGLMDEMDDASIHLARPVFLEIFGRYY